MLKLADYLLGLFMINLFKVLSDLGKFYVGLSNFAVDLSLIS